MILIGESGRQSPAIRVSTSLQATPDSGIANSDPKKSSPGEGDGVRIFEIPVGSVRIKAILEVPDSAKGLVVIFTDKPEGRFSPHNHYAARAFRASGLATLLVDLVDDSDGAEFVPSRATALLVDRVLWTTRWAQEQEAIKDLPVGYFCSGEATAAALAAAAEFQSPVRAIVAVDGHPDRAWTAIPRVHAATLFIVPERDLNTIRDHRMAFSRLLCEKAWKSVDAAPGFEQSGAFEQGVWLASPWLSRHLDPAFKPSRIEIDEEC